MTDTTTSFVSAFNGRIFARGEYRRVVRFRFDDIVNVLGTVVAACSTGTVVAVALINTVLATNSDLDTKASTAPEPITLTNYHPTLASAADFFGPARVSTDNVGALRFEARWAHATAPVFTFTGNLASLQPHPLGPPQSEGKPEIARAPDLTHVIELTLAATSAFTHPSFPERPLMVTSEWAESVPLPWPLPAPLEIGRPRVTQVGPQVAVATSDKRVTPQQAHSKSMPLPDPDNRTAVYDIAAHTVYLPNGDWLEAHSGLTNKLDDPRYVSVKNRGPTPPNIYVLSLREQPFHGVQAIRLIPVDGGNMFGRDGILAHPYMLSANGQSNGCVSIKDYPAFLQAYLRGEVERLVVVPHLGNTSLRTAGVLRGPARRFADNNP